MARCSDRTAQSAGIVSLPGFAALSNTKTDLHRHALQRLSGAGQHDKAESGKGIQRKSGRLRSQYRMGRRSIEETEKGVQIERGRRNNSI